MTQIDNDEQPYIPVEAIRFVLQCRREYLAKLAKQNKSAETQKKAVSETVKPQSSDNDSAPGGKTE